MNQFSIEDDEEESSPVDPAKRTLTDNNSYEKNSPNNPRKDKREEKSVLELDSISHSYNDSSINNNNNHNDNHNTLEISLPSEEETEAFLSSMKVPDIIGRWTL